MTWWLWIVIGFLLMAGEILTPGGFFLIFFGVSALIVGILAGFNLIPWLWFQLFLFAFLSGISVLFFRKPILEKFSKWESTKKVDDLRDENAIAMEKIDPEGFGKVELRGSSWNAKNVGTLSLEKGQRCVVTEVNGLTLFIRSEN